MSLRRKAGKEVKDVRIGRVREPRGRELCNHRGRGGEQRKPHPREVPISQISQQMQGHWEAAGLRQFLEEMRKFQEEPERSHEEERSNRARKEKRWSRVETGGGWNGLD